jgi:hypothetical protein
VPNSSLRSLPFPLNRSLRHSSTALLISKGENIKYSQSQLGHVSVQTSLDRYRHLLPAIHKEAAQRLDQTLLGPAIGKPFANGSVAGEVQKGESPSASASLGLSQVVGLGS